MRKNLFLTTALISLSFIASNALAESITKRQVISSGTEETFDDATATGLSAPGWESGGVIYNEGTTTINNSTFTNNDAWRGGAIYNAGTMTIIDSTIADNFANVSGGAIYNGTNKTLTIKGNTTFEGNGYALSEDDPTPNDIFNVGTLNLETESGQTISF